MITQWSPGDDRSWPAREFDLVAASASHSRVLVWSIASSEVDDRRIELCFTGVAAMKLRRRYDGLEVVDLDEPLIAEYCERAGVPHRQGLRGWLLRSQGVDDYILGGRLDLAFNGLGWDDKSEFSGPAVGLHHRL